MSMLFGPLSETISSVSWRDCALAGEKIAGADRTEPAASAVADLRNSRRFIEASQLVIQSLGLLPQRSCHRPHGRRPADKRLESISFQLGAASEPGPRSLAAIAYKRGIGAENLGRIRWRGGAVGELDRREPLAVDLEVEHVEAVVVSDHVVKLLRLDALGDVDVLVEQALALAQRVADHLARRS